MQDNSAESILNGSVEALNQGLALLDLLSDEAYTYIAKPYVTSSIGAHFRHILDLYFAIIEPVEKRVFDYDKRRRGAETEFSRAAARRQIDVILHWLNTCPLDNLDTPCQVMSEVLMSRSVSVHLQSTLSRELVFASSHTVHHFALISVIARLQSVEVTSAFGVAPATASYLVQGDQARSAFNADDQISDDCEQRVR